MKAKTATNHLTSALRVVEPTKDALSVKDSNEHVVGWRRNAALIAVGSFVAAACGFVAVRTVALRKGAVKRDSDWKAKDAKLDRSLKQAANTSDATATY